MKNKVGYFIDANVDKQFKEACHKFGLKQSSIIEKLIRLFLESNRLKNLFELERSLDNDN